MKKIYIKAYTYFNLGDDLFIKMLVDRYPNTNFYLPNKLYNDKFNQDNLTCYSYKTIVDKVVLRLLSKDRDKYNKYHDYIISKDQRKYSDFVYIGGSIFMQTNGWERRLIELQKIMSYAKNFFVIGCNFGPFHDDKFYKNHKSLFNKFNDICFREKYSYDLFKDNNNSRLAPDVVYGLDVNSYKKECNEKVVISVINLNNRADLFEYKQSYYNNLFEIISNCQKMKKEVVLMSFCKSEGDEEAINEIMRNIKNKAGVSHHFYTGDLDESLSLLLNAKAIVATRFHASILALVGSVPLYPFIYSNKTINALNDIGFKGNFNDIRENKLTNFNLETLLNDDICDVNKEKIEADKQFYALDNYLGKGI